MRAANGELMELGPGRGRGGDGLRGAEPGSCRQEMGLTSKPGMWCTAGCGEKTQGFHHTWGGSALSDRETSAPPAWFGLKGA